MAHRAYTPQEDAMILAASTEELTVLAERLGRRRNYLIKRRIKLRGPDPPPSPKERAKHLTANVLAGRPVWFEDDDLALKLRSGR